MKKTIGYLSVVAFLSIGLFFTSCKKEKADNNTDTSTTTEAELQTQSDDQQRFTTETDAAADDASTALENSNTSNAGERPMDPTTPFPNACDFSVAIDTTASPRTITLNYTGTGCLGNRTRTGKVVLSFAPDFRWGKAGATFTVTYVNLKVTRKSDGKAITINGTETITNVSGGRLIHLATRGSAIIHDISSSNMSVTFDNGTQRTWQLAKRRTFTYDNGIVISVTGRGTASAGLAEWGVNRFGKEFTNSIIEPLVVKQSCDFRLVSGKTTHTVGNFSSSVTFGLDAGGLPVTICPTGLFYLKAVWTGPAGATYTVIAPY